MNTNDASHERYVPRSTLSGVVLYEDLSTRQRAVAVCDDLIKQFWPEIRFKFDWWHVNFLDDEGLSELAARAASVADLVIYCGSPERPFSVPCKRWFQRWSQRRSGHGGALVDLTEISESGQGVAELKKLYLRDIASRAFMDYVTKPPTQPSSFQPARGASRGQAELRTLHTVGKGGR